MAPDPRHTPFLTVACQQAPCDDHIGEDNEHFLDLLAEVLLALPLAKRERLVIQDVAQNRVLSWWLAILSNTLTPEVTRRAVWKIADLENR